MESSIMGKLKGKPIIISVSSEIDNRIYSRSSPLLVDCNWEELMALMEGEMQISYGLDFKGRMRVDSVCEISEELYSILMKDLS